MCACETKSATTKSCQIRTRWAQYVVSPSINVLDTDAHAIKSSITTFDLELFLNPSQTPEIIRNIYVYTFCLFSGTT